MCNFQVYRIFFNCVTNTLHSQTENRGLVDRDKWLDESGCDNSYLLKPMQWIVCIRSRIVPWTPTVQVPVGTLSTSSFEIIVDLVQTIQHTMASKRLILFLTSIHSAQNRSSLVDLDLLTIHFKRIYLRDVWFIHKWISLEVRQYGQHTLNYPAIAVIGKEWRLFILCSSASWRLRILYQAPCYKEIIFIQILP